MSAEHPGGRYRCPCDECKQFRRDYFNNLRKRIPAGEGDHPGGRWSCPCDECRQFRRECERERYRTDPDFRERVHAKNTRPDVRERGKIRARKQRRALGVQPRQPARSREERLRQRREQYAQDPKKILEKNRSYETEATKARRQERLRRWRAKNPEKVHWSNHQPVVRERRLASWTRKKRAKYLGKLRAIPAPCALMRWNPEDDDIVMCDQWCVADHQHARTGIEKAYRLGRSYDAVMSRRGWLRRNGWPKAA